MPHATSDEYPSSSTSSSSSTTPSRTPSPPPSPLHLIAPQTPDFPTRLVLHLTTPSTPRLFSAVMAEERMRCVIDEFDLVMGDQDSSNGYGGTGRGAL
ncbi:hypothetical protein V501_06421 [Pseudogymnoascus sp. VKM F-4519 (FW-2642)]|nr:hypothetical protein V501_06421 [Pseudogymnoascus sp. VKM F-4519 (FW-2642)]